MIHDGPTSFKSSLKFLGVEESKIIFSEVSSVLTDVTNEPLKAIATNALSYLAEGSVPCREVSILVKTSEEIIENEGYRITQIDFHPIVLTKSTKLFHHLFLNAPRHYSHVSKL